MTDPGRLHGDTRVWRHTCPEFGFEGTRTDSAAAIPHDGVRLYAGIARRLWRDGLPAKPEPLAGSGCGLRHQPRVGHGAAICRC